MIQYQTNLINSLSFFCKNEQSNDDSLFAHGKIAQYIYSNAYCNANFYHQDNHFINSLSKISQALIDNINNLAIDVHVLIDTDGSQKPFDVLFKLTIENFSNGQEYITKKTIKNIITYHEFLTVYIEAGACTTKQLQQFRIFYLCVEALQWFQQLSHSEYKNTKTIPQLIKNNKRMFGSYLAESLKRLLGHAYQNKLSIQSHYFLTEKTLDSVLTQTSCKAVVRQSVYNKFYISDLSSSKDKIMLYPILLAQTELTNFPYHFVVNNDFCPGVWPGNVDDALFIMLAKIKIDEVFVEQLNKLLQYVLLTEKLSLDIISHDIKKILSSDFIRKQKANTLAVYVGFVRFMVVKSQRYRHIIDMTSQLSVGFFDSSKKNEKKINALFNIKKSECLFPRDIFSNIIHKHSETANKMLRIFFKETTRLFHLVDKVNTAIAQKITFFSDKEIDCVLHINMDQEINGLLRFLECCNETSAAIRQYVNCTQYVSKLFFHQFLLSVASPPSLQQDIFLQLKKVLEFLEVYQQDICLYALKDSGKNLGFLQECIRQIKHLLLGWNFYGIEKRKHCEAKVASVYSEKNWLEFVEKIYGKHLYRIFATCLMENAPEGDEKKTRSAQENSQGQVGFRNNANELILLKSSLKENIFSQKSLSKNLDFIKYSVLLLNILREEKNEKYKNKFLKFAELWKNIKVRRLFGKHVRSIRPLFLRAINSEPYYWHEENDLYRSQKTNSLVKNIKGFDEKKISIDSASQRKKCKKVNFDYNILLESLSAVDKKSNVIEPLKRKQVLLLRQKKREVIKCETELFCQLDICAKREFPVHLLPDIPGAFSARTLQHLASMHFYLLIVTYITVGKMAGHFKTSYFGGKRLEEKKSHVFKAIAQHKFSDTIAEIFNLFPAGQNKKTHISIFTVLNDGIFNDISIKLRDKKYVTKKYSQLNRLYKGYCNIYHLSKNFADANIGNAFDFSALKISYEVYRQQLESFFFEYYQKTFLPTANNKQDSRSVYEILCYKVYTHYQQRLNLMESHDLLCRDEYRYLLLMFPITPLVAKNNKDRIKQITPHFYQEQLARQLFPIKDTIYTLNHQNKNISIDTQHNAAFLRIFLTMAEDGGLLFSQVLANDEKIIPV
ncbi:MAG: hypothetical protein JKY13_02870, partial [Gammaproteobacteria bacterium]|nr:hypothetical protein [Gammaproteobacteria bacterium]